MSLRMKRIATGMGLGKLSNKGIIKISILLCLLAVFMFVIFAVGTQKTAAADCDCNTCHSSFQHPEGWNGCSTAGCHDSPPQTPAHLTHYNNGPITELVYGDTAVSSVADAYKFGCGNCHPLDNSYHRNGVVNVELYNAAAPALSVKAKNPPAAAYNPVDKTCSNVYCHSGFVVTSSGPVGNPLTVNDNPAYFPLNYKVNSNGLTIMDETCSSVQYAPYTVNTGREYKTTPVWGTSWNTKSLKYKSQTVNFVVGLVVTGTTSGASGTITADGDNGTYGVLIISGASGNFIDGESLRDSGTGAALVDGGTLGPVCTQCHQFPLTTFGPTVEAGVGDGHQWYNDWEGWAYGHANNMDYGNLNCSTCHYATANSYPGSVGNPPTTRSHYWKQVNGVWVKGYYPVELKSRVMHVNGNPDVSFNTVDGYRYYWAGWTNIQVPLTTATYDPETKTCSNVGCHYGPPMGNHQQEVKWGSPYRGWYGPDEECDQCHRYGTLGETCTTP